MYFYEVCSLQDAGNCDIVLKYEDIRIDRFLNDMYEISCIESFKFFSSLNNYVCVATTYVVQQHICCACCKPMHFV